MDRARRRLLGGMAGMLAAAPAAGFARGPSRQTPGRVAVCLHRSTEGDPIGPARRAWGSAFARHGLVDGREIEIFIHRPPKRNYVGGGAPEWERAAERIVASRPDVIVMVGAWLPIVKPMTHDIPIVFYGGNIDLGQDAKLGIDALRRPGGNVTGLDMFPRELKSKNLELLKELRPDARRHAIVGAIALLPRSSVERTMKAAAERLGMDSVFLEMPVDPPIPDLAGALLASRIEVASFLWNSRNRGLHEELVKLRVAASFPNHDSVEAGGLLSYQPVGDFVATVVLMAARILRGEPVSSIPVEQPREFRLAINLRTARALGITIPASMLVRAHEVFE